MEEDIITGKAGYKNSLILQRLKAAVEVAEETINYDTAHNPEILYALDVVKNFIKRKKRVCYGGTAINAILPTAMRFYNPDLDLPDYDFFTPDQDADIRDIVADLRKAGFNDIYHRQGIHEGTYKILVNFIAVADITAISQEVFDIFKTYRLKGLEGSQLHFADKYGTFGIIVADSMWITKANYQISTNYNLCHPNKDNINCWRFPIAERLIKSRAIGLETFRDICDSTSQEKWTNYSNIQNLNTGDIWFYYAMNYSRPYKTNIKELLKKGNRSFYMYELFKDDPLVKQILQSKETENQFFLVILASLFINLLLTIYILTIKRRQRKLRNLKTKN